jgi:HAD superfamily hydrolase (TIGR01509 family)
MIKAALFDLDGVLIDSETLYTQFWENVGKSHKLPSPTFAYDIKGTTLIDILTTHFPDPEVRADVDRLLHKFENEIVYPIFPGALEFVDELRRQGVKTVIVTSSDNKKMDFLFAQHPDFPSHFDAVVTAADVTHSKPHPEPYLVGAAKVGVAPEECLVFEDSFQGLESGRRAGCRVVGIATTNPAEAIEPHADLIAPSLKSLHPLIQHLIL